MNNRRSRRLHGFRRSKPRLSAQIIDAPRGAWAGIACHGRGRPTPQAGKNTGQTHIRDPVVAGYVLNHANDRLILLLPWQVARESRSMHNLLLWEAMSPKADLPP